MKEPKRVNRIQCLNCGEILESKFRHDFQRCSCENRTFTDGGNDYYRYGGMDMRQIAFLDDENNVVGYAVRPEDKEIKDGWHD